MSEERSLDRSKPHFDPYQETQNLAQKHGVTLAEAATVLNVGLSIGLESRIPKKAIKATPTSTEKLKELGVLIEGMSVEDWLAMEVRMLKAAEATIKATDAATGLLAPHLYNPRDLLTQAVEDGFRTAAQISFAKAYNQREGQATLADLITTPNITEVADYVGRVAVETMHEKDLQNNGYEFPYKAAFEPERLVVNQVMTKRLNRRAFLGVAAVTTLMGVAIGGGGGYVLAEQYARDNSEEVARVADGAKDGIEVLNDEMIDILREAHKRPLKDPLQEVYADQIEDRINHRTYLYRVIDQFEERGRKNQAARNWFIFGGALAGAIVLDGILLLNGPKDQEPPTETGTSNLPSGFVTYTA